MKKTVLWLLVIVVCAVAAYAIISSLFPPPYADIPRITNSGGFWYPVALGGETALLERFASVFGHQLRTPPAFHQFSSNYVYYDLDGWRCGSETPRWEYCAIRPHFVVTYDSFGRATSIVYHLGDGSIGDNESFVILKEFADKIGFEVTDENRYDGGLTFYAADGGTLRMYKVFTPRTSSMVIDVGGWSNGPLPEMQSDAQLYEIARDLTDQNMDMMLTQCPNFVPVPYVPDDINGYKYKYIYDGVPVLRLVLAMCTDPVHPSVPFYLYAHIDRQTGTEVHFEMSGLAYLTDYEHLTDHAYLTDHAFFSIRP